MADEIDVANDLIHNEVSRALSRIRESEARNVKGAKICGECGDSLPEARQKLGFSRCVPCVQEAERHKLLYVGN